MIQPFFLLKSWCVANLAKWLSVPLAADPCHVGVLFPSKSGKKLGHCQEEVLKGFKKGHRFDGVPHQTHLSR